MAAEHQELPLIGKILKNELKWNDWFGGKQFERNPIKIKQKEFIL